MTRYLRQTERYLDPASLSRRRLAYSENLIPDGITRETIRREPLAPWMANAHGARLVDVDGDERIDFVFNHTALIHGHTFEPVTSAISHQAMTLEAMSFPNDHEARLASLLVPHSPITAPLFRFTSSGSEAVLLALRLAQVATQRHKIVVFEHCYHGGFIASSNDDIRSLDYLICPFGDVAGLRGIFTAYGTEIAAVLADLCPVRGALTMASPEFSSAIGDACAQYGALLVADEVVSSRAAPTGIASQCGLTPDIACLGKYIGGGLPIGAITFKRDLARYFASDQQPRLGHGGTYNGNPLSMAAGTAAMQILDSACTARLDAATEFLCDELTKLFTRRSSEWTARRAGSLFHLWPHQVLPRSPSDVKEQHKARRILSELSKFVLRHGAVIAPSGFGCVATVTSSADIDYLVAVLDTYIAEHLQARSAYKRGVIDSEDALEPIYLSAISFEHGEPRSLAALGEPAAAELSSPEHGLLSYRVCDQETWQLAVPVGERTLAMSAHAPDLLIYVSESDLDTADSLIRITRELGLPGLNYISVRGHGCGNLGPALRVAADALYTRRYARVLLILADRVIEGSRIMPNGLSVFSDGAAACMVTRDAHKSTGTKIKVCALTTKNYAQITPPATGGTSMLDIAATAADAMTDILRTTSFCQEDFKYVLFANYRIISQKFLTSAMGFPVEQLLLGSIGCYGHCFSADILVTLGLCTKSGSISSGDRLLASATGSNSWSVMVVEVS